MILLIELQAVLIPIQVMRFQLVFTRSVRGQQRNNEDKRIERPKLHVTKQSDHLLPCLVDPPEWNNHAAHKKWQQTISGYLRKQWDESPVGEEGGENYSTLTPLGRFPSIASFLLRQSSQRKGPSQGFELVEKMEPAWTDTPLLGTRIAWHIAHVNTFDVFSADESFPSLENRKFECLKQDLYASIRWFSKRKSTSKPQDVICNFHPPMIHATVMEKPISQIY